MFNNCHSYRVMALIVFVCATIWSSPSTARANACHPFAVKSCLLPFPSDIWTWPAPESPTGRHILFPDNLVSPQLMETLPKELNIQTIFNGDSGFSAATPVLFELAGKPLASSIDADADAVIAVNLATGQRIPIDFSISEYARSKLVAQPSQVVEIFPLSRWPFGTQILVALTHDIRQENGRFFNRNKWFHWLMTLTGNNHPFIVQYQNAIDYLGSFGVEPDDVLSATIFTVRTEEEVITPLLSLAEDVYSNAHPIRKSTATYTGNSGPIAAIVQGEVRVDSYRNKDFSVDYFKDDTKTQWLEYRLTLPQAANKQSVPIVIYGHGLGVGKETDLLVSLVNAEMGLATISIDQPNHGSRRFQDGGFALSTLTPEKINVPIGMIQHSSIDFFSLLKAVQTDIGTLDIFPRHPFMIFEKLKLTTHRDGIPEIDTSQIYYQGTSLGGVLGSSFLAIAPDIKGAFLHVAGTGLGRVLADTILWETLFHRLIPDTATGAEALFLRASVQHLLDYSDGINFIHLVRDPLPGMKARPVAMIVGKDDGVVPNSATLAMAQLARLPLAGKVLFPMQDVNTTSNYVDGYGIKQLEPKHLTTIPLVDALLPHLVMISDEGLEIQRQWIKDIVLKQR